MNDTITYICWPDPRTAPDWVRVPTIEVTGYIYEENGPEWSFTITQHPPNKGTQTLPDQRPYARDEHADQLRLNAFEEGWPALNNYTMTQLFAMMAVRQPTRVIEIAAILAELGAVDGTAASRAMQGLPG